MFTTDNRIFSFPFFGVCLVTFAIRKKNYDKCLFHLVKLVINLFYAKCYVVVLAVIKTRFVYLLRYNYKLFIFGQYRLKLIETRHSGNIDRSKL